MRLLDWPKGDLDLLDLEIGASKRERRSAPDSFQDLDDLFQNFLTLAGSAKGNAQLREFKVEVPNPQTKDQSSLTPTINIIG
jgi:hypothetical protein